MDENGKTRNSFRWFSNRDCEFFPCHDMKGEGLNCLFCFCPMYDAECLGEPGFVRVNGRRVKDCSGCDFPHRPDSYDTLMEFLLLKLKGEACGA